MLTRWNDFASAFSALNEMRQRMERAFDDTEAWRAPRVSGNAWPRVNLYDNGTNLVIEADLPGLTDKDITISASGDGISLSGERKVEPPHGYSTHRRERTGYRFSRSFTFPVKVDLEKTIATMKNGVLTVTLPKAAESRPRQIAVKSA